MRIIVNGRDAVLKSGTSFDYVAENRLFLGRDGFSFNIVFPLHDCPENLEIFGHIDRMDVAKDTVALNCEIRHCDISLSGSLLVSNVNEREVTCQFAEGRCEQTAIDPFEETYISDLDLGEPAVRLPALVSTEDAWAGIAYGKEEVALPWINEAFPETPNNDVVFKDNAYEWAKDTQRLSWQPYLIVIAKRICNAVGYSCDFTQWEQSDFRNRLICNTLPASWEIFSYSAVLPKWTVTEFFEKLELFLVGEFDFDHRLKSVSFKFSSSVLGEIETVHIEDVTDSYSVEMTSDSDEECEYLGAKKLMYKECSHSMWKFYSCDDFANRPHLGRNYDTIEELIEYNRRRDIVNEDGTKSVIWGDQRFSTDPFGRMVNNVNGVLYARDVDTSFVFRSIGTELVNNYKVYGLTFKRAFCQLYVLQPINIFGNGTDSERTVEEIEFVPVCIMETDSDHGNMMFLSFSDYNESAQTPYEVTTDYVPRKEDIVQPLPTQIILDRDDDSDSSSRYYDEIYVGFWDGSIPFWGAMPYPTVDPVNVSADWKYFNSHLADLRLYSDRFNGLRSLPQIDSSHKYKFSFISQNIPNPRAIFHIKGRRYVCEKITATFTESGMSQLLKGEFYPLLDD